MVRLLDLIFSVFKAPLIVGAFVFFCSTNTWAIFDRGEDAKKREALKKERARLIQKMIIAKKKGAKTKPVKIKAEKHYHCDTVHDEMK